MIDVTLERHDDVTRVRLSHWRSRAAGYEVSVYLYRGALVDSTGRACAFAQTQMIVLP